MNKQVLVVSRTFAAVMLVAAILGGTFAALSVDERYATVEQPAEMGEETRRGPVGCVATERFSLDGLSFSQGDEIEVEVCQRLLDSYSTLESFVDIEIGEVTVQVETVPAATVLERQWAPEIGLRTIFFVLGAALATIAVALIRIFFRRYYHYDLVQFKSDRGGQVIAVAKGLSWLAILILVMGLVGALLWIFNPECIETDAYENCVEKDWLSSWTVGISALLVNTLTAGTVFLIARFAIWRVNSQK